MRILILSVADLRHMTCVSSYCEFFTNHNISFDILCTDRYEDNAQYIYKCNIYKYTWRKDFKAKKIQKIKEFLYFRKFVKKIIQQNEYDYVVVWGENAALLFSDILLFKFKGKYCINIRDIDLYKNIFTKFILNICTKKSIFSTVPSPAALCYLKGNRKVLINKDLQILNMCKVKTAFKRKGEQLNITYMGLISPYIETFKKIIKILGNDKRYLLKFYGENADTILKKFVSEEKINNVICGGKFPPLETINYLNETDILNSYYPESNSGVKIAIGVKESYVPFLKIPCICNDGCYWGELSEKYNFGFPIKNLDNLGDELYTWYHSLNFEDFEKKCQEYISFVENANKDIYELWEKYFLNNC